MLLSIATLVAGPALAQELIIFPSQGQSDEQMEKDKYDCYQWAKKETGFDPMEVPKATEPPPKQEAKRGGLVRGAVGGAAIGGIIDGSDGAKKGAAAGGVLGGARRQTQKKEQRYKEEQWAQDQAAQYNQKRNTYNRAYAACLEGKEYTVK
ncbi:MAG: hypothetical protein JRF64_01565 [Deltaproteobacteria bacterium]|nr:hypothetical protein [Deltaproteobacteria bacterium]MBW2566725.1 hypothetical protein [Deltaproteobacteria bacterium]